jgi:hypothetical protein
MKELLRSANKSLRAMKAVDSEVAALEEMIA